MSQVPKKIVSITEEAFMSVSAEDWAAQCKHVEHLEEQYLKNDGLIDEEMDRLIISTANDSETAFTSMPNSFLVLIVAK